MSQEFDQSAWAAQWSAILPALRRRVATFDIAPQDVDDVLSETAERLCRARYYHPKLKRFRRTAQGTAWLVAREIKRTRTVYELDVLTSLLDASPAPDAAVDQWGKRQAVEESWRRLSPKSRKALGELVLLSERGGPYDERQRQFMSRTRRKLRDRFSGCLVVGALIRLRWRWLRAELAPAAGLATAGVVAVLAVGMAGIPAVGSDGGTAVDSQAGSAAPSALAVAVNSSTTADRPDAPVRPIAGAESDDRASPPPRSPIDASVIARLPTPDRPGVVKVTVLSIGGNEASVEVRCDSGLVRQAVCAAYSGEGTDPSTSTSR